MNEAMVCSFFGHRKIEVTDTLYTAVTAEIMKAVELGCRIFYFGGFGDFDDLCYRIVTKIMTENRKLKIERTYCVPQERYLRKNTRYFRREDYENTVYLTPAFDGWYKSIYFRNLAMVDQSDFVIFFAEERENSGAYKTYKYAKKKREKHIVNLWI